VGLAAAHLGAGDDVENLHALLAGLRDSSSWALQFEHLLRHVGQDGVLRRIGNPPVRARLIAPRPASSLVWGARPIDNRPQVNNLAHRAAEPQPTGTS